MAKKKQKSELTKLNAIFESVANDPKVLAAIEDSRRRYGTLTAEDYHKQFTI